MEKKKRKKKKSKNIIKFIFTTLLILFFIVAAAGTGITIAVIKSAPNIDTDIIDNLNQSSKIYDKDGNYIQDFADGEVRTIIPSNEIPDHLKKAFVAIEDERFYSHHGVDFKRIGGAIVHDILTMSKAQGASTITQQLIKNYALTSEKLFTRKLQEMYLSLQIERKLTKDQILHAYLNTIYLGGRGIYGVQAAANKYFNKDAKDLTIAESAVLAGLIKFPSKYYPLKEAYLKDEIPDKIPYMDRQRLVLKKMRELGYITEEQYQEALQEDIPLVIKKAQEAKKDSQPLKFHWFVDAAMDQVISDFADKHNISEDEAAQRLRTGGYKIYLTMDTNLQIAAQKVIDDDRYYKNIDPLFSKESKTTGIPQPQASAVVIDHQTGQVRAIIGGRKVNKGSINRATEVRRQTGSSIKPLADYGPAIDMRLINPGTVLVDEPINIAGYTPDNEDNSFLGSITVRDALRKSRNTVAVKVAQMVGISNVRDYLINKFHLPLDDSDRNLGIALGAFKHGFTPYEMAAAYGVFGNNGIYIEPTMYTKVTDKLGNDILVKTQNSGRALSPQASYLTLDMLVGNKSNFGNMPSAGKTGTTDSRKELWYCGVTPYYSGAVMVGHTKNLPLQGRGYKFTSTDTSKIWQAIMKEAHKNLPYKSFTKPDGIIPVQICLDSGKVASDLCSQDPRGSRVATQWFIEGSQPVEICDEHVSVMIDKKTNKLATPNCPPSDVITKVFLKKDVPTEYCPLHSSPGNITPPTDNNNTNPDDNKTDNSTGSTEGNTSLNNNSSENKKLNNQ